MDHQFFFFWGGGGGQRLTQPKLDLGYLTVQGSGSHTYLVGL